MRYDHLIGLPFEVGKNDCFSMARHFYADNFDIQIKDYARPNDWDADLIDILRVAPLREGFEFITNWRLDDVRPGDSFALSIGSSNANHIGVYVGDNKFIHHLANRLSSVEDFRDFWVSRINYLIRHPQVPDLRPVKDTTDVASLLRDRYSVRPS